MVGPPSVSSKTVGGFLSEEKKMNSFVDLFKKDSDARVLFISFFLAVLPAAGTLVFAVRSRIH
jgi:hypothetical protein